MFKCLKRSRPDLPPIPRIRHCCHRGKHYHPVLHMPAIIDWIRGLGLSPFDLQLFHLETRSVSLLFTEDIWKAR